jgi:hypothetical protein
MLILEYANSFARVSTYKINGGMNSTGIWMRSPGFEPGSSAWEADVLPN